MASTKLSRTAGSTGNRRTWTWSGWVKRAAVPGTADAKGGLFSTYTDTNNRLDFGVDANHRFFFKEKESGSTVIDFTSTRLFRDPSAFYHFVIAVDTTDSTAADRVKVYVNGERITSWLDSTAPSQNRDTLMNVSGRTYIIGSTDGSSNYWNGLMSYVSFVDGTAYDASYFGETNAATGIWTITTSPSVTYGTNGFFLKMDTSSPGSDTSGNNNTYTASGTPTLAQDNASNNLATMNPLDNYYQGSIFSNGNNTFLTTDVSTTYNTSSIMVNTGKWYVECKVVSGSATTNIGIVGEMADATTGQIKAKEFGYAYINNGEFGNNGSASSYGSSYANGDIIGIALDCTNNKLYFSKNGTFQDSGNPSAGSGGKTITAVASTTLGLYTFAACDTSNGDVRTFSFNFGNGFFGTTAIASSNADAAGHGLFEYAVPTGYYTLNTKNLNTYGG